MATSVTISESSPKKARYASEIMSFSQSRLDAESSGTMCIDSGTSCSCESTEHHEFVISKRKKNVGMYGTISVFINLYFDLIILT